MQISFYDGEKQFKIDKPIRLIELFAGYGSQDFALEYLKEELDIDVESYKICEWAVKSIQAYKDAHFPDDNTDYSKDLTDEEVLNYLFNKGISQNYNEPMTYEQIKRLGSQKQRQIYNNIKATHNLVNIQQVNGYDLDIVDTDKYCYVMTYSFPCQDLSLAGKRAGMGKGSGTRSGMLWEVERILDELDNKPQVLLMENVPEVIGTNNVKHFAKWLEKLESLGYKCYWQVLNAKDYGVPQNRERCFMVSVLGDYFYEFPEKIKLGKKLKDLLEDEVAEKFYLSDKAIDGKLNTNFQTSKLESVIPNKDGVVPTICARDYKDPKCIIESTEKVITIKGKQYPVTKNNENFIEWKQKGFLDSDCRAWKDYKISGTLTTNGKNKIVESNLNTRCDCLGVVVNSNNKRLKDLVNKMDLTKDNQFLDIYNQSTSENAGTITTRIDASNSTAVYTNYRIRKLTPKECFRLMGVKDQDFEKIAQNQSNASLYHLAGDSIVVNVLMAIFKEML